MSLHPVSGVAADDEGEAFARAVFGRFLRQATICRDIDDAIEHMHIVNDNSRTFEIRLGGETRIPIGRELILALAAKKKELLGLCESTLLTPRVTRNASIAAASAAGASASANADPVLRQHPAPLQAVVFPPPTALTAMESTRSCGGGPRLPMMPAVTAASVIPSMGEGAVVVDCNSGGGGGGGGVADRQADHPAAVAAPRRLGGATEERTATAPIVEEALRDQVNSAPIVSPEIRPTAVYNPASMPPSALVRPRDRSGPTTIFVRKVDAKMDRESLMEHFSAFGEVLAMSLNATRGYAFVDYPSHDCVLRAVSAKGGHRVLHKTLVVEAKKEKKEPPWLAHR